MEIKRGQMYWANLCFGKGSMQGGQRPVIIFSNDLNNRHSKCVTIVPLTTRNKKQLPTHEVIQGYGLDSKSISLAECITTIDKSLLYDYIGKLTEVEMKKVEATIAIQLGLNLAV